MKLPVRDIEAQIVELLHKPGTLVISAPTGSGKTTQVPQMLRAAGNLISGQIVVLQPRRLATRLVARRVAGELGEAVGGTVGYQTRHERVLSPQTRICFCTEGLFLRRLLADPNLGDVGAVVLDEFHERSLHADLALGYVRRLRQGPRPDLRCVVMSATLDVERIASFLDAPALETVSRSHPVEVEYDSGPSQQPVWQRAAAALQRWLDRDEEGDVLIFMPGIHAIRRTVEGCERVLSNREPDARVLPLHGSLSPAEQDRAAAPHQPGEPRRIVVATNVAQTSITIDGIRCVIDSGLARVHRFDPRRGVNALLTENISTASADQRSGRAGRIAPGHCYRLWPAAEAHGRTRHDDPEVHRIDLAECILQLKALGVSNLSDFDWLETPTPGRLTEAVRLLRELSAVDADGRLTDIGAQLTRYPAHPRLGRLLVEAERRGVAERAAVWSALIAERDICTTPLKRRFTEVTSAIGSDLKMRESAFRQAQRAGFDERRCNDLGLRSVACREVARTTDQLRVVGDANRAMKRSSAEADAELAKCLLTAYPDHLGRMRGPDRLDCEMDGRRRVSLDGDSVARESMLFVAIDLREVEANRTQGGGVHTVASLATAVEMSWLEECFPKRLQRERELAWSESEQAVLEVDRLRFGQLSIAERWGSPADSAAAAAMLVQRILAGELKLPTWDDEVDHWLERCRCIAEWFPEFGLTTWDNDDLAVVLHELVAKNFRFAAVRRHRVLDYLKNALSWNDLQRVDHMAPERLTLPSGHGMRITYRAGEPPRGQARIQDLYDVTETPRVADGRVALLLEILAPNFRPAQITDDLENFWKQTYPELKKELMRRYPKHEWR
ncbi:MAG: ATP-dependent helicase HrpB [Candidatus Latescibacterota bacterium]|nr:ATP-dependent helicase HrpB [Candidatus Latescibacterota bacterium]